MVTARKQVITIHHDASVSGLEVKKGVDFKTLGRASVERVSLVQWHEGKQAWYVAFIAGKAAGTVLSLSDYLLTKDRIPKDDIAIIKDTDNGQVWFLDYDDAVMAEVAYLDSLRLNGVI